MSNSNFKIYWDLDKKGRYNIHCLVYAWSPSVKRELLATAKQLAKENSYPTVFCVIPFDDKKLHKFVSMLNFKRVTNLRSGDHYSTVYRLNTKCFK